MSEESTEIAPPKREKRPYKQRQPQIQAPVAPSPHIVALEGDYVQLVRERQKFVMAVNAASGKVNQAQMELNAAQGELQQIDGNIQFIAASIQQMKNGGMPVPQVPYVAQNLQQFGGYPSQDPRFAPSPPYNPVAPFPTAGVPTQFGVAASYPGRNDGLYPDASPRGNFPDNPDDMANTSSAEDVRAIESAGGTWRGVR